MEKRLLQVYQYWFGESVNDLEVVQQKGKLWFAKDDHVDREIRDKFADLVDLATEKRIVLDGLEPKLALAVILLLDQFTRNIYRNSPRSFSSDPLARELALDLINRCGDLFRPIEKVFLYLPLEHSENLDDQKRSVALYRHLNESVDESLKATFSGFFDYAVRHHDIIARFGRFPHRNSILGRNSTAAELEFLTQPGSSF